MSKVTIFRQACKGVEGCGICVFICPKNLFHAAEEMNEMGYLPPEIDNDSECTGCMNCMLYCPDFAIVSEKDSEERDDKEEETQDE